MLLPQLYFFLIVEKVPKMLHLLNQNRVSIRDIHSRVDNRAIFLAQLLDIWVFLLGQLLDILLPDDGHRQGNGQLVDYWNLDDQFVFEVDEERVEEKGKDLLARNELIKTQLTAKAKIAKRQLSLPEGYSLTMFEDSTSISPSYSEKCLLRNGSIVALQSLTTAKFCSLPQRCTTISTTIIPTAKTVKAWYHRQSWMKPN